MLSQTTYRGGLGSAFICGWSDRSGNERWRSRMTDERKRDGIATTMDGERRECDKNVMKRSTDAVVPDGVELGLRTGAF